MVRTKRSCAPKHQRVPAFALPGGGVKKKKKKGKKHLRVPQGPGDVAIEVWDGQTVFPSRYIQI